MRVRNSVLGFASRHPRAPSNSASSLPTFTTKSFYKNETNDKAIQDVAPPPAEAEGTEKKRRSVRKSVRQTY
jgi:hypothetical protein